MANEALYWGFAEGAVEMAPWGSRISRSVRTVMDLQVSRMKQNSNFNPFCDEYGRALSSFFFAPPETSVAAS